MKNVRGVHYGVSVEEGARGNVLYQTATRSEILRAGDILSRGMNKYLFETVLTGDPDNPRLIWHVKGARVEELKIWRANSARVKVLEEEIFLGADEYACLIDAAHELGLPAPKMELCSVQVRNIFHHAY